MKLEAGRYFGKRRLSVGSSSVRITVSRYEPNSRQPWHTHANPTFFLQLTGEHQDETEHSDERQPPLTLSYHPTTSLHRSRVGSAGMTGLNIEVTDQWLSHYGLEERELGALRILKDADAACRSASFCTRSLSRVQNDMDLDAMVFEMIEPFVDIGRLIDQPPPFWLIGIGKSILDGYAGQITVTSLAREAGVHPVYLCRAFRRYYGRSVNQYLNRVRASEACKLICQGLDAGSAALHVGYYDQFHLSRTLAKTHGFTPRDLKRVVRYAL